MRGKEGGGAAAAPLLQLSPEAKEEQSRQNPHSKYGEEYTEAGSGKRSVFHGGRRADRISQQIFGCETALSFLFLFPRTEVGIAALNIIPLCLKPTTWKMQNARQWQIRPPSSRRRAALIVRYSGFPRFNERNAAKRQGRSSVRCDACYSLPHDGA